MTERATLMGLAEPSDLASTSCTPAASRMARRGTAGDDAGTGGGGLEQHATGAMLAR